MLLDAYRDLKYLLNRGYRKKYALEFVANHYRLTKGERYLLARCVFSDEWVDEVRRKLLRPEELRGRVLGIDGFNVLITLESLLEGRAILCEDGLVRDLKYQGRYRLNEGTERLLGDLARALGELGVEKAVFFYGSAVPRSGEVKRLTEEALIRKGVNSEVRLVKSPDFELKAFETVATADIGIISKVSHVFDLAAYVGRLAGQEAGGFFEILGKT
ncbi:DUF434 domain-containing protein [Thermococcus aciditolerans]|uniref:DUF434 domain-containing protein n=1 Tax=Thermococcus aciditolerans TaxID=2598455 RepID=A0A5C0SJR1_9EURY|nr:DUF434 domain-containing protein [Thermococcus aciditolerans]QEK14663.1 DUF434 domain-containing protein [Thermococcus aciditolerans]